MVFAARLLIRFTTLMPQAFDLHSTGRDLESLVKNLRQGNFVPLIT
jgi:hypothetical protein